MSDATRIVETFSSYDRARSAVDRLIDHDVPADAVSISGRGIRLVEQIHPRGWLGEAADGALGGATIGLFVGFFLGLFSLQAPGFSALVLGFWGAVIGSVVGAVTGLAVHAFRGDSTRSTVERSLDADLFDLEVHDSHAVDARRILARHAESPNQQAA